MRVDDVIVPVAETPLQHRTAVNHECHFCLSTHLIHSVVKLLSKRTGRSSVASKYAASRRQDVSSCTFDLLKFLLSYNTFIGSDLISIGVIPDKRY